MPGTMLDTLEIADFILFSTSQYNKKGISTLQDKLKLRTLSNIPKIIGHRNDKLGIQTLYVRLYNAHELIHILLSLTKCYMCTSKQFHCGQARL